MKANIDAAISVESNKFGIDWVMRDNTCNFGAAAIATQEGNSDPMFIYDLLAVDIPV